MSADAHDTKDSGSPAGRVFVSYSRDDSARAKQVIDLLGNSGLEVWWDGLLEGGENYLPATEAALEGADCVVVLWSRISIDSHWVRDEAQSGRERTCLVPVSIDGAQAPLGFRQFQTIDASSWNGRPGTAEADKILEAVLRRCGAQPAPRPANAPGLTLSRRNLAVGGAAVIGAGVLAMLGLDRFGGPAKGAVSLAVMPFANLSQDPEQVWFSNGLANELRAALTRNPRLRVSAPTSSAINKKEGSDDFMVARQLGVDNVLRGSVQLVGETVRISAELLQVSDGLLRWATTFDRQMKDVLAVQSEIAGRVAVELVAQIASEGEIDDALREQQAVGGTTNVSAYEEYLRGHALYDLSVGAASDRAALARFDAAIALDPGFAKAHAMRSTMLGAIANLAENAGEIRDLFDQSVAAAQQAIDLAPDLAQAHVAKGFALSNGRLDVRKAEPHYERARKLAPGDADILRAVAAFFSYGTEKQLARDMILTVLELDPLNGRAFRTAGYINLAARDYAGTISRMDQALTLNPKLASAQYAIGYAHYFQNSDARALSAFQKEPVPLFALTGQAMVLHRMKDTAAAKAALDKLIADYGNAGLYQQAQVRSQWGQVAEALDLLDRAYAAFDPGLLFLQDDPTLDPLRGEDAFIRLQAALSA